jgi:hypothetical protein
MQSAAVIGSIVSARLDPSAFRVSLAGLSGISPAFGEVGQHLGPVGRADGRSLGDCLNDHLSPVLVVEDSHQG